MVMNVLPAVPISRRSSSKRVPRKLFMCTFVIQKNCEKTGIEVAQVKVQ